MKGCSGNEIHDSKITMNSDFREVPNSLQLLGLRTMCMVSNIKI